MQGMKAIVAVVVACASLGALAQSVTPPPIAARAYYVLDALSGQAIAAAEENTRYDPASLTKLMTAYLVFGMMREHKLEPGQRVTVSERAGKAEGARMFLDPRQPVTIEELLEGLVVQSGNDAAVALAEAAAGSEDAFVERMNRQAEK